MSGSSGLDKDETSWFYRLPSLDPRCRTEVTGIADRNVGLVGRGARIARKLPGTAVVNCNDNNARSCAAVGRSAHFSTGVADASRLAGVNP